MAGVRLHGGEAGDEGVDEGELPVEGHGGEGRHVQEDAGLGGKGGGVYGVEVGGSMKEMT